MKTGHDEQVGGLPDDVGLVRRPQRFFILPSLHFWSSENLSKIHLFVVPPVVVAATAWFFFVSGIPWLPGPLKVVVAGAGGAAIAYLTLGLAERFLRMAVARRRKTRELKARRSPHSRSVRALQHGTGEDPDPA